MNFFKNIKKKLSTKASIIRYKIKHHKIKKQYNKNFGHRQNPLIYGEDERGYGRSTIIVKDAIKRNLPIMVPTRTQGKHLQSLAELEHGKVELYYPDDNLVKGKKLEVLFDGDYDTFHFCCENNITILNGFMFIRRHYDWNN